jgi:hypothetical protein
MYARHPEMAKEWQEHTPKGKKLPEKVKHSFALGAADALARFGFKQAGEEIRLKIPRREFHGWDEAFRSKSVAKRASEGNADSLAALLGKLDEPLGPGAQLASRDPLDRSTAWGAPSHLDAGDTAGRLSDMGQNTTFGGI